MPGLGNDKENGGTERSDEDGLCRANLSGGKIQMGHHVFVLRVSHMGPVSDILTPP